MKKASADEEPHESMELLGSGGGSRQQRTATPVREAQGAGAASRCGCIQSIRHALGSLRGGGRDRSAGPR